MNTLLYKSAPLNEIVDADDQQGIVKGYASVFGNVDSDGDVIVKGAYSKTLSENKSRVKYLRQHDITRPIGVFKELYEDNTGLPFVAQLAVKTIDGKDAYEQMKAGLITENSVGILPIKKLQKDSYRELVELKLYEISAVTLAANDQAKIDAVKGSSEEIKNQLAKRYDGLMKLLKADISDELGYMVEAELQSLKALHVTKPSSDTLPKSEASSDALEYLSLKIRS